MAFFDRQTASLSRMKDLKETNFTNVKEHVSHVGAFNYLHFYREFFATVVATKTEKMSAHLPVTQII